MGRFSSDHAPTLLQRVYELVLRLDGYLGRDEDGFTGEDVVEVEQKVVAALRLDDVDWQPAYSVDLHVTALYAVALLGYREALVEELTRRSPDYDRAMRLTRLALLAALLEIDRDAVSSMSRQDVSDRLNLLTVVLDGVTSDQVSGEPRRSELVREAKRGGTCTSSDGEWAGYLAGEIANIRNVMAGESFRQRDYTTSEVETTTTAEVETRRETETEDETKVAERAEPGGQLPNWGLRSTATLRRGRSSKILARWSPSRVSAGVDAGFSMQRSELKALARSRRKQCRVR